MRGNSHIEEAFCRAGAGRKTHDDAGSPGLTFRQGELLRVECVLFLADSAIQNFVRLRQTATFEEYNDVE
jgi:hypothetical protein